MEARILETAADFDAVSLAKVSLGLARMGIVPCVEVRVRNLIFFFNALKEVRNLVVSRCGFITGLPVSRCVFVT